MTRQQDERHDPGDRDGTPQRTEPRPPRSAAVFRFLSVYGLLILLVVLFVVFSLLLPNTFPTEFNIRAMLSDKSIIALLALAEMVPVATNSFDLSIGYGVGLYHILAVGLLVGQGVPWPLAIVIVLAIGALVGVVNGVLVTRVGIDPFIATLGVGTFLYGISFWYAPYQIVGRLPQEFIALAGNPFGIPLPFVYVVIVAVLLWIMFERLPIGRYLYMLGSNQRASELVGISPRRYITFAFVVSGLITAFAGIILGAKLQVASTAVGPGYLLPAFVAALLGSTTIRPGRVNVIGTLVAVFLLAIAVAGLQQLGAQFFVEPLFNGTMLVTAVGLAAVAARRRARIRAAADAAALR
jgi:ribose transport system permease protein